MSDTPSIDLSALRRLTPARVRLAAAGGPAPLAAVLDFQLSHAKARDAIHGAVDWDALAAALAPRPCLKLASQAPDRATYIRRPDLGRRLAAGTLIAPAPCDIAVVIADGLSATAVSTQALPLVAALEAALPELDFGPIALVAQGRVAVGDEVAAAMGAKLCLMLIGERPGLSVSDSLGAYLTLDPAPGTPDSARNCVSNIHGRGGLGHAEAAARLAWLIRAARAMGVTGVGLKDEYTPVLEGPA